jgi:hypothetical protein
MDATLFLSFFFFPAVSKGSLAHPSKAFTANSQPSAEPFPA